VKLPGTDFDVDLSMYAGLWLIDEKSAARLLKQVESRDWTEHVKAWSAAKAQASIDESFTPERMGKNGDVAVISISGVMSKHGSSLSPQGSTIGARSALRMARAEFAAKKIKAAVIRWETPGGTVAGTAELAADVRKTAAMMPVLSLAEDMLASAGVWGASFSQKIYLASRTTNMGSIGAVMAIDDVSEAFKKEGVDRHIYKTGKYKSAGMEGTKLGKEEDAFFQNYVNAMFEPFAADFKTARNMTDEQFSKVADGRIFVGEEAVSLGLADGIKSFEEVLAEAEAVSLSATPKGAKAMADERKPASLPELKKAIPGASAEFREKMIEGEKTIEEARSLWLDEREAQAKAANEANEAKAKDLEKRENDLKAKAEAGDGGKKEGGGDSDPVKMKAGGGQESGGTSNVEPEAVRKFNEAKASVLKLNPKMSAEEAHLKVCEEQPEVARAYMLAQADDYQKKYPNKAAKF
jgi:signal peptide peptidase SppA